MPIPSMNASQRIGTARRSQRSAVSPPPRPWLDAIAPADRVAFMALAALLALACVLGGGTQPGLPGDGVLQLLAVPMLGLGLVRLRRDTLDPLGRYALAWLGLVLALFALHLLPLPSTVWTALGGRTELAAELAQAGVPLGWHALSLNPYATERMLWSLLPPVAVFVAALGLDEAARRRLLLDGQSRQGGCLCGAPSRHRRHGLPFQPRTRSESPGHRRARCHDPPLRHEPGRSPAGGRPAGA